MKREEAYNRIDSIIAKHEIDDGYVTITSFLDYDALRMARKALEQEPCEDVISRQAVIERLKKEDKILYTTTGLNYLIRAIEELPSVNPQKNIVNNGTMNITL